MAPSEKYEVEHRGTAHAPAKTVYGLLADLSVWPRIFPPIVHVEYLERDARHERARIWLQGAEDVRSWVALRTLHPETLQVTYRQEVAQHPVADMGGGWIIEPTGQNESLVRLRHDYRPVTDDAETVKWIDEVLDRNSGAELDALLAAAEVETRSRELLLELEDGVHVNGTAQAVYDFLYAGERWHEHFAHISGSTVRQAGADAHILELESPDKDGRPHITRQVRVGVPNRRIVYKQLVIPPLSSGHTGEWSIRETGDGVEVTARQTIVIREEGIAAVLGPRVGLAEGRDWIERALGGNARLILEHAKAHAERPERPERAERAERAEPA
ncbi:SRPBCC family protein [Streptosporangium sp. NPDC051022]|uniref:aromatase/cyclase n=1 Tax=Streptosporangium sp. NPDC051022 TaxID=3155752 RepID=UPI00341D0105